MTQKRKNITTKKSYKNKWPNEDKTGREWQKILVKIWQIIEGKEYNEKLKDW
jgi:hypothetical protein